MRTEWVCCADRFPDEDEKTWVWACKPYQEHVVAMRSPDLFTMIDSNFESPESWYWKPLDGPGPLPYDLPLCTAEHPRGPRGLPDHSVEIWHLMKEEYVPESDFHPIACSEKEGINLPGHPEHREPTCPDCVALLESES